MAFAPIFIVGVPRSGTTLLRVLLDSHPEIAALPETPWLLGAYGSDPSLRGLLQGLIAGPYGAVRNVSGVEPEHVLGAGRRFLETLFEPALRNRNKRLLAFKTPADIRYLDFLLQLVPDALFIHITRDGRDVAISQLAKKGSFFNDLKEYRRVGFANLLRRWVEWEQRIRILLCRDGVRVIHVRYEDLTADPRRELQRIVDFLGVNFEARMIDYGSLDHDYPNWEAGSSDVAKKRDVSSTSAGKWRQARTSPEMLHALMKYDRFLVALGYPSSDLKPNACDRVLAALFPLVSPILEVASRWRFFLPLIKNRARLAACTGLLLLAGEFLIPGPWLQSFAPAADAAQPMLCAAAALGATLAFGRRSAGSHPLRDAFARIGLAMLGGIGILEAAQNLIPGRHAALGDWALNAGGALLAVLAGIAALHRNSRVSSAQTRPATQAPAFTV